MHKKTEQPSPTVGKKRARATPPTALPWPDRAGCLHDTSFPGGTKRRLEGTPRRDGKKEHN